MAQVTDRNVGANPTGFDMRTELNNIIGALESDNSGSSEPLNTVAYMKWLDTSNATYYYYKERNHDNTAWVTLFRYTVATKIMEAVSNGVVLNDVVVHKTGDETIAGVKTFSGNTIHNGNVSIGTNSPKAKLHISGKTGYGAAWFSTSDYVEGTAGTVLNISTTAATGNCAGSIDVGNSGFSTKGDLHLQQTGGDVLVTGSGGLGYGTGSGGTVTQLTSKSTVVTLNKPCGKIITASDALAAGATVAFICYNSLVGIDDLIYSTSNFFNKYDITVSNGSGGFTIAIKNKTNGSLSEAIALSFTIIKGSVN